MKEIGLVWKKRDPLNVPGGQKTRSSNGRLGCRHCKGVGAQGCCSPASIARGISGSARPREVDFSRWASTRARSTVGASV